ncbi:hypothetical protein D3C73_754380 [compost metagenome]
MPVELPVDNLSERACSPHGVKATERWLFFNQHWQTPPNPVGAGLPAKAVHQIHGFRLTLRFREQARSHRDPGC